MTRPEERTSKAVAGGAPASEPDTPETDTIGAGSRTTGPEPGTTGTSTSKLGKAKKMDQATIFKFVGLIAFFILMGVVIACVWPYISEVFEEGGLERVTTQVRDAGVGGIFILLAFQFLQIVVAFIPGEVVQMAAGVIYGPWWGALIILIGCVISSAFIFVLVHKLGAPFVQAMVPQKYMKKMREFESSPKFNVIIFILFLIPGMPKDVFTYITPLSHMRLGTFVALTNTARIPGIVLSTYAANGLVEGRIWESVLIFLVLAIIAGLALLFYNKIINAIEKRTGRDLHSLDELDKNDPWNC